MKHLNYMEELDMRQQMESIGTMLDVAMEHQMEVEVIYSALKYMKENTTISPMEAFALGVTEWVK